MNNQGLLSKDDAHNLAVLLRSLADPMRLRLLNFFNSRTTACQLEEIQNGLSTQGREVGYHLQQLRKVKIIGVSKKDGCAYYYVRPEMRLLIRTALKNLLDML